MPTLALLLAVAALTAGTARPAHAAATGKPCGVISVSSAGATARYRVRVIEGRVACTTARAVMRTFSRSARSPRGWVCFRGHASQQQAWAATCASTNGSRAVRSWLVRG